MTFKHVLTSETLFKERLNSDKDWRTFCYVLLEKQKHIPLILRNIFRTSPLSHFDSVLIIIHNFYCLNDNSIMYIFFIFRSQGLVSLHWTRWNGKKVMKIYKRKRKFQKCQCHNLKKGNPQRSGRERKLCERPIRMDEGNSVFLC
jgi:hypothetical protein